MQGKKTIPAGDCPKCQNLTNPVGQRTRDQWRDIANDAVMALKIMRYGDATHGDLRNVDDIIQTHEIWKKDEETS